MAKALRRQRALIVLAFAAILVAAAAPDHVLVRYSFDDDDVDTGPDTFAVFERAKGSVKLSRRTVSAATARSSCVTPPATATFPSSKDTSRGGARAGCSRTSRC